MLNRPESAPARRRRAAVAAAALVTAALLAAAGCTSTDASGSAGDTPDDRAGKPTGPSVVAPGKPGEQAATLAPEEAAKKAGDNTPNSADVAYVRMMIEHHQQALTMTELAPDRVRSAQVRRLAERIEAAQGPEIDAMKGWLKQHGKKLEDDSGHEHGDGHEMGHGGGDAAMPGMATKAQLDTLRKAKGAAFDELFLKLMITHHGGAVTMATDVLSDGKNIQISEMANDVIAQQTSEIERMRKLP
ncbi:DUF305 domain-containing protein [Streptomyces sp. NPDC002851]